jgi:5-methylcytosine-specific restriction endonuclease McrA
MGKLYLEKHDPVKRAERILSRPPQKKRPKPNASRRRLPALNQHAVQLRDNGQCTFVHPNGKRCPMKKWLATHHKHHWAKGGGHELSNLGLLCAWHHRFLHSPWGKNTAP